MKFIKYLFPHMELDFEERFEYQSLKKFNYIYYDFPELNWFNLKQVWLYPLLVYFSIISVLLLCAGFFTGRLYNYLAPVPYLYSGIVVLSIMRAYRIFDGMSFRENRLIEIIWKANKKIAPKFYNNENQKLDIYIRFWVAKTALNFIYHTVFRCFTWMAVLVFTYSIYVHFTVSPEIWDQLSRLTYEQRITARDVLLKLGIMTTCIEFFARKVFFSNSVQSEFYETIPSAIQSNAKPSQSESTLT